MQVTDAVGSEEVARAATEVARHEGSAALSALAFDVLSRQAEGQTLFAGKKHVETLAEERGISREDGETERGNVFDVLTRGPENAGERALVAAFAVAGLSEHLDDDGPVTGLSAFVRHADWLEVATPYVIYAFVDRVLSEAHAARVWSAVADAAVGAKPSSTDHGARAVSALRIAVLGASESDAAVEALARVAKHAADPAVRAAASFARGEVPDGNEEDERPVRISGRLGRPRGGHFREVVRIASGWALATWTVRSVLALVGVERPVEVQLVRESIEVRGRVTLLGRVIREREEVVPITGLARLSRDVRYPALHLLVGLTTLSAGVLVGGVMAADAARSGATWFLVVGAVLILAGAGLDLALDVLVPARRKHVSVELASTAGPVRRIEGIPPDAADRFIAALKAKL